MHFKQGTFSAVSPGEEQQYVCFIQRNSAMEMHCRSAAHKRICTLLSLQYKPELSLTKPGFPNSLILSVHYVHQYFAKGCAFIHMSCILAISLAFPLCLRPTVCASEAEGRKPVIAV